MSALTLLTPAEYIDIHVYMYICFYLVFVSMCPMNVTFHGYVSQITQGVGSRMCTDNENQSKLAINDHQAKAHSPTKVHVKIDTTTPNPTYQPSHPAI